MTDDHESRLRPLNEIQAAHDLLHAIVTGEVTSPFEAALTRRMLEPSLQTLCWVLRHDGGRGLENLLMVTMEAQRRRGKLPMCAHCGAVVDHPFTHVCEKVGHA